MTLIADKVYRNAKVYSIALDGKETHAEAVAIKDGKFVYVGNEAGIAAWIGDTTTIVDCHGKSVLPGLADAHMHLAHSAELFGTCSFSRIVPNPQGYTRRSDKADAGHTESLRQRAQRSRSNQRNRLGQNVVFLRTTGHRAPHHTT